MFCEVIDINSISINVSGKLRTSNDETDSETVHQSWKGPTDFSFEPGNQWTIESNAFIIKMVVHKKQVRI
jgi:hypothetical protein